MVNASTKFENQENIEIKQYMQQKKKQIGTSLIRLFETTEYRITKTEIKIN